MFFLGAGNSVVGMISRKRKSESQVPDQSNLRTSKMAVEPRSRLIGSKEQHCDLVEALQSGVARLFLVLEVFRLESALLTAMSQSQVSKKRKFVADGACVWKGSRCPDIL